MALSLLLTAGFVTVYLLLQKYQLFPVTDMPVIAVDQNIPFIPDTVYLYKSLWLLLPIGPWLVDSKIEFYGYVKALLLISSAGFLIFFFFPTAITRPSEIEQTNLLYRYLIGIDSCSNACPSLHVALAILSGACCRHTFRKHGWHSPTRCLILVWVIGIIFSTLTTKQHVLMDVVAGALLGACGSSVFLRNASALEHARAINFPSVPTVADGKAVPDD